MRHPILALIKTSTLLVLFHSYSFAQELTPPEPISMAGQFAPAFGGESIVKARFTVKADGSVDDLRFEELHLANQFVRNQLRSTVNAWTFKPATVDGNPVDYHNHEFIFALRMNPNAPPPEFGPGGGRGRGRNQASDDADSENAPPVFDPAAMEPIQLALSADVKEAFDEINALISADDFDRAAREVRNGLRRDVTTVFDYALLNTLKADILVEQNDLYGALEALKLATMTALNPQGEKYFFMTDDILQIALRKKLVISASLRQHGLVLSTYDELQSKVDISDDAQLSELANTSRAALDSPEPLPLLAKIVEDEWSFKPSRRIFTVSNVEGRLNDIELLCERRDLEVEYEANVDWTLPAALGDCELNFKGRDGTTFVVYQFSE